MNEKAWIMGFPPANQEILKRRLKLLTQTRLDLLFSQANPGRNEVQHSADRQIGRYHRKTAMAKPEEFDAVYEKEMADYMSLGGAELKKNWNPLNNKQK